jgi:hypothetical protein
VRSIQAGTLLFVAILGASCGNAPLKRGGVARPGVLSHAQVESLVAGTPATQVIHEFGPPASQMKEDGRVLALAYEAENAQGEAEELRIALDPELRVAKWTLAPRKPAK